MSALQTFSMRRDAIRVLPQRVLERQAAGAVPAAATARRITTRMGEISVLVEQGGDGPPLVFMHGVFLDRSLWRDFSSGLTGRTHIYIDMPSHGDSADPGRDWSLDDCVQMLAETLDALAVRECILIGHSWGSMTALRAASRTPSRFAALGLFNMPHRRAAGLGRLGFSLQKLMTRFPRFYAMQAAKSLYTRNTLRSRPEFSADMQQRLSARRPREIARTIDAVILGAADAGELLNTLKVPALAVVGASDYVGIPPGVECVAVPGGHISPHEAPAESLRFIKRVIEIAG